MPESPQVDQSVDRQFQIARYFIIGFFVVLAIALIHYFLSGSLEAAKFAGTLFGGWVGMIVGFYFGQRPTEQLRQSLKIEMDRTKELTSYIKTISEETLKKRSST